MRWVSYCKINVKNSNITDIKYKQQRWFKKMIGQVERTQPSLLSSVQQKENQPVQVLEVVNNTESIDEDQVTYDKYGNATKYGIYASTSVYVNEFSKEDLTRWKQISQNQGPLKIIFDDIACKGMSSGTSMTFLTFAI